MQERQCKGNDIRERETGDEEDRGQEVSEDGSEDKTDESEWEAALARLMMQPAADLLLDHYSQKVTIIHNV